MSREEEDWTDIVTPAMLRRRVTLDEYFAEKTAEFGERLSQAAVDQDHAQLEARVQPHDEWWVWVLGTVPLMQMGGLALVRCGKIVWARNDWIS